MAKGHGAWIFASTVVATVAGAVMFAAEHPYSTTRSNLGSWAEGLGFNDLAAAIPEAADAWATWIGASVLIAAVVVAVPHVVALIKEESTPSLIDGEWIFHFNPSGGYSKPLSFERDGTIGKGRNRNEYRWTLEGGDLAIWRADGSLQNRFRHAGSPDKFVFVPDPAAQGIKDQFIERP